MEGDISTQVLKLNLGDKQQDLDDSFSSNYASSFNKGATDFLQLVEAALEQQQNKANTLRFSELVMQMMDLDLDQRVPTTHHVAEILNDRGWNPQQVARVWSVPADNASHTRCSDGLLRMLGGKDILTEVWLGIKGNHMTGFPKRPAVDAACTPVKRLRMDGCRSSSISSALASPPSSNVVEVSNVVSDDMVNHSVYLANLMLPSQNDSSPALKQRRGRTARRRKPALREKIIWWFIRQDDKALSHLDPAVAPEKSYPMHATSPDMFLCILCPSTSRREEEEASQEEEE